MQKSLVEDRRWFSQTEYNDGLAFSQMLPGPLATQLGVYLGWIRSGIKGASLAALGLVLPPFLMVVCFAALYQYFGSLHGMETALSGVGAAVISIIAIGAFRMISKTLTTDLALWAVATLMALHTVLIGTQSFALFLLAGVFMILIKAPPRPSARLKSLSAFSILLFPQVIDVSILERLFTYFFTTSAMVFGSGMVIIPLLHSGVVNQFHWLSDRQFLDAVSVGMFTPGPIVITTAFIGFLVASLPGAVAATIGTFLPTFLFVVMIAPFYRQLTQNKMARAFVSGVTSATLGALVGAAFLLGRKSLTDTTSISISILSLIVLLKVRRLPEPLLLCLAALAGYFFHK